ncbi:MAG: copper chaperone PCu(A)C [Pseudomonadota bacterium]|jgi:periplasmic copper chaperone A|uniref:copper chaperone PCu(A)C n=1 Tax=Alcanivorax sp. TaxID=1872427 RepID=UPI0025BF8D2D|nr:copper chaperone PCu(A)C [Alcanivorax sp.]MEE3319753.1 copper chaperone PCu(A)C [Pseudomonadota bacterium]
MMQKVFSKAVMMGVAMVLASPLQADLLLSHAWLRAVPPVSPSMAGYVTVTNEGDARAVITGAHTGIAGHTMLHDMTLQEDGTRRMRHLGQVEVPAGESVSFAPGALHLMLMHLSRVPTEGETVEVCLELADEEPVCGDFPVSRTSPYDS